MGWRIWTNQDKITKHKLYTFEEKHRHAKKSVSFYKNSVIKQREKGISSVQQSTKKVRRETSTTQLIYDSSSEPKWIAVCTSVVWIFKRNSVFLLMNPFTSCFMGKVYYCRAWVTTLFLEENRGIIFHLQKNTGW